MLEGTAPCVAAMYVASAPCAALRVPSRPLCVQRLQVVEKAVLVATPVKNAKDHIEKYFTNLAAMAYPKCAPDCAPHAHASSLPTGTLLRICRL